MSDNGNHLDIREEPPLDDRRALDLIAELMSGREWSADTLDEIAGVVMMTGREIANYEG